MRGFGRETLRTDRNSSFFLEWSLDQSARERASVALFGDSIVNVAPQGPGRHGHIGADSVQMLAALTPHPRVANQLAWKQLFPGHMACDSRQNASSQMSGLGACLSREPFGALW